MSFSHPGANCSVRTAPLLTGPFRVEWFSVRLGQVGKARPMATPSRDLLAQVGAGNSRTLNGILEAATAARFEDVVT